MPLNANALTTIENARLWCLRDSTDDSKDDLFTLLINSVSRRVARHCAREFFPTDDDTRLFAYDGSTYLNLAPYDLRAITAITVTPAGGSAVTLDPDNPDSGTLYKMNPRNKTDEGTYLWLSLPVFRNPGAFPEHSRVGLMSEASITGDWGMEELPADLEEAVLITIEDEYLNPAAAQRVQVGPNQIDPVQPSEDEESPFPRKAMLILEAIRRSEFAA